MSARDKTRAEREQRSNPRYTWIGEKPRWQAIRLMARSRLLVLTSESEGGANVVSEAIACRVPVLSTHISGSVGLLGSDYPGYFTFGDTQALADLLYRAEKDPTFYRALKSGTEARQAIVRPSSEKASLKTLLADLT